MKSQEQLYQEFLEVLSSNEHPSIKFNRIRVELFKSFYDVFHKIDDNPRNLKIHPDYYNREVMWKKYCERILPKEITNDRSN
jgi:hypothetical protein